MNSVHADNFLDLFDDHIEATPVLSSEDREAIGSAFADQEALETSLAALKERIGAYDTNIQDSDRRVKEWQEAKKMWKSRKDQMLAILGEALKRLHVPGQTLKANGVKLSTSKRSSIEVDEDWLTAQFQSLADALQQQLPEYIKLSLSVDKTRLSAFLKKDNSLLVDYPEKVHVKESTSTTIK